MATVCLSTQEYPPRVGGVGVAAQRLARHLVAAGYDVHVVTPFDTPGGDGRVEHADENGVMTHRLHADFSTSEAGFAFRQLVQSLDDEHGFDLFHGFFLTTVYPCVSIASRGSRPRPVIASIRGSDALTLLDQPYLRSMIIPALRKATWITSVNQLYLDRVGEEVDVRGRSSVIRNGIVQPPEAREPWQVTPANRGVVGTVGQFRRVKDIPLLVRGYAAVPRELRSRLLLAGYFDDRDEEMWTEVLLDELGVRSEVEIVGRFPNSEVVRSLRRMHVYVQSSAYEGLPNALLEAASVGVPLVATAVGGMAEVLNDGENGLLVPHGEPGALAAAIERVLRDDDLAARLSAGARTLAAELSPERERDAWLALYGQLL